MRTFLLFLFALAAGCFQAPAQEHPRTPPQLDQTHAGADLVSGKSAETAWPVRIKVFDIAGNVLQQRDVLVNASDSSIIAGFPNSLQAGQIVQASFLLGSVETMPSAPLVVAGVAQKVIGRPQPTTVRIRGELVPGATNVFVDATPTIAGSGYETRIYACPDGVPAGIRDSVGFKPYAVTDATGQASITFEQPLAAGQSVSLCQKIVGTGSPAASAVEAPGSGTIAIANPLDLGRVRYYFTSGVVLSSGQGFQLNTAGTQASLFLELDADRAWLPLNAGGFRRLNVNSYLGIRLTSVPTQQAQAGSTLENFVQSQKAASFQAGAYLPLIVAEPWSIGDSRYSLFLAPLGQAGFTTLTGDANSATSLTDRFFKSYSFGARLGVFEHFHSEAAAPELISYLDITRGRFGDFEAFRDLSSGPASSVLSERPWRYSLEGLFKVPHSPFVLGFNANIGTGGKPGLIEPRDDLRFLFGAQFDFSKFLKAIPQF